MTGNLYLTGQPGIMAGTGSATWAHLRFVSADKNTEYGRISMPTTETRNMRFIEYVEGTSYSESYILPSVTANASASSSYSILTTKAPVSVAQGGTGATSAADARTNLNVVNKSGDTMTGTLVIDGGSTYKGITIKGASDSTKINFLNTGARLTIDQFANGSTGGERYLLPTPEVHDSDVWYSILTNKSLISIGQGGTGASSAAEARTSLGITPENIEAVRARRCIVGHSGAATNTWFKVATLTATSTYTDIITTFLVEDGYSYTEHAGLLRVHIRLGANNTFEIGKLTWISNTGYDPNEYVLNVNKTDAGVICDLYTQVTSAYVSRRFTVLAEGLRVNFSAQWTLLDNYGTNYAIAALPDGTKVYSTYDEKLSLSGGTMTGSIVLAGTNGIITSSGAGYATDAYGNFVHRSTNTSDLWGLKNNSGTLSFSVNYESGAIQTLRSDSYITIRNSTWPSINFISNYSDSYTSADIHQNQTSKVLSFMVRAGDTQYQDIFSLPAPNTGRTADSYYQILTTKTVGTMQRVNSSTVSVESAALTNLASITLEAGHWIVWCTGTFQSNSTTGYRQILLASSATGYNIDRYCNMRVGAGSSYEDLNFSVVVTPSTTTTYYLNCRQDSGSAINVQGGLFAYRVR